MREIRDYRATMVVAGIVLAIVLASFAFAWAPSDGDANLQLRIHDGDGNVQVVDLSQDATIEVATSLGSNTVVVRDGAARIVDADCPNGDCLRQGAISRPGQQIICLPHRLWLEVAPPDSDDSQMDVDAVTVPDSADDGIDLTAR